MIDVKVNAALASLQYRAWTIVHMNKFATVASDREMIENRLSSGSQEYPYFLYFRFY